MKSTQFGTVIFKSIIPAFCTAIGFGVLTCALQGQDAVSIYYTLKDLGTLGGPSSSSYYVSNNQVSSGIASLLNGTNHAALWFGQYAFDIAAPGLGGRQSGTLNSAAYSINEAIQAAGVTEVPPIDPNAEDFCGYGTSHRCVPFFWASGTMFPLPLVGGTNGQAISINGRTQLTGVAENGTADSACAVVKASQILDYEPVVWSPLAGKVRTLPLPGSDSVGVGLWLNDVGQVVGQTGSCANTTLPPLVVGPHAILWDNDGSIRDLGNLGGDCLSLCVDPVLGTFGNTPLFITNKGEVVGSSALSNAGPFHAFLWTKATGRMQDLGTIPGDVASVALGMNGAGSIVGLSLDSTGMPHAFIRKEGRMIDLETLIPVDSPLVPLGAEIINDKQEIAGFGFDPNTGNVRGFLAVPTPRSDSAGATTRFVVSDAMRSQIQEQLKRLHSRL